MVKKHPSLLRFKKGTWGRRVLDIRHALGWSQIKLSTVSRISLTAIVYLETGRTKVPDPETIAKLKNVEFLYPDIMKEYKKHPIAMSRLIGLKQRGSGVKLAPVEVRRPEDIESLEEVGADSQALFFGRKTRRKMQFTGLSMRQKIREARRRDGLSRSLRQQIAEGRSNIQKYREAKSRQSSGK
jgi:transcriptional regulator with XRE-family HTH domain